MEEHIGMGMDRLSSYEILQWLKVYQKFPI